MSDVVCASGDADPRLSRVGQVSAYVGLLAEAYNCAKTQLCFRDGDGADCVGSVFAERDAFAVDECRFEGQHGKAQHFCWFCYLR